MAAHRLTRDHLGSSFLFLARPHRGRSRRRDVHSRIGHRIFDARLGRAARGRSSAALEGSAALAAVVRLPVSMFPHASNGSRRRSRQLDGTVRCSRRRRAVLSARWRHDGPVGIAAGVRRRADAWPASAPATAPGPVLVLPRASLRVPRPLSRPLQAQRCPAVVGGSPVPVLTAPSCAARAEVQARARVVVWPWAC